MHVPCLPLTSCWSMLFQSPSPTSFQRPFEHATAATRHHYQNVWCIKYLPVIYCSCLYLCSSLISFAFSLIFLPFVPCFSNLHLPLHSNGPLNMQLQQQDIITKMYGALNTYPLSTIAVFMYSNVINDCSWNEVR